MKERYYPFVNEPLPYDYAALEPYIDEETMHYHHDKHLQTYVDNLNNAVEDSDELKKLSLEYMLANIDALPEAKRAAVRNNGGGVYNHTFYFKALARNGRHEPQGELKKAIEQAFGDFASFCASFKKAALGVFGSGYAWLVKDGNAVKITTTPNQNTPLADGVTPILCLDVWEHAYYLKHKNMRAAYIDDWFNTVDFAIIEQRYCASSEK